MPPVTSTPPNIHTRLQTPPKQTTAPETHSASELNGDVFGVIMGNLSHKERASSRGISTQWNRWLNKGLGVPRQVKIPSLPQKNLRQFLSSVEIKNARAIDASNWEYRRQGVYLPWHIEDSDMEYLVQSRKVKAIDLKLNPSLGSNTLKILSDRFPNLEYLSLHGCSSAVLSGLSSLGKNAKNLKRIMLSHRNGAGCAAINAFLCQSGGQLESLCITSPHWNRAVPSKMRRTQADSAAYQKLPEIVAATCPGLKRLALPWYTSLTNNQLDQIIKGCKELTTLHVSTDQLNPAHVHQILKSNPNLKLILNNRDCKVEGAWKTLDSEYGNRVQFSRKIQSWWKDELGRS